MTFPLRNFSAAARRATRAAVRPAASLLLILMFSGLACAADYTKVDIAAAPAGGAWYVGLGAYAKVLSDRYSDFEVSLFPGGGIANILRVAKGDSQIGITAAAIMKAAHDGTDPYRRPVPVAALGNLNDITRVHFVVPADSSIRSIRQIVDEKMPVRMAFGSKVGGNAELFVRWICEEYGMSKKQLQAWGGKIYNVTNQESTAMMQEGQLDVDTWLGPGEAYRYQELLKTKSLRILDVDEDVILKVREKYGLQRGVIPASFYGGLMGRDVVTVVAPTALVVNKELPDDMVYRFAKALAEGAGDIAIALPAWDTISPATLCRDLPVELHPGAARYYRETGCLK